MKLLFCLLAFVLFVSTSAFARISSVDGKLYVVSNGAKTPIFSVNQLIKAKAISRVKLYEKGQIHILSFAKKNEREKLYSVDYKGYIYSIDPFASYRVQSVDRNGRIEFKEVPGRKYHVSSKGFFLY